MLSFLASSCAACSKASLILSEAHSVAFHLSRRQSPASSFCACSQSFYFQVLSGWRFQLPLTLYSCLLFFLQPALGTSLLHLLLGKSIPIFLGRMVLFSSFSKAFTVPPFAPRTVSTANLSVGFSPFCLQIIVVTFLATIGSVPHLPVSPPTPTARS